MAEKYDHAAIEKKWQEVWEKEEAFRAEENSKKPKQYLLVEFPYPSGSGLHTGHARSYTAMDIVARKRRAEGQNVLYPIGWDAFGLPTENYALKTGKDPRIVTKENTDNYRRQLRSLGFSFDWSREINTTDPNYYKWTQWIFLQLYKHGLAYKTKTLINWCPKDKIGLANEEVVDGACERCGTPVEKREKEQWMLAITKYAQRLYDDLDTVNYIEAAKAGQRNWIGPSEGAEFEFDISNSDKKIKIFTTRPDTLFGATYLVLAPEHEEISNFKSQITNKSEVEKYVNDSKNKSDIERSAEGKEKTGVELKGIKAINPANKAEIPVFIADYVLGHYGTGAIMAVPAHDERDFEFAKKFNIPVVQVIEPVFVQTSEPGAARKSEPFFEPQGIIAVVKHWSEDKYLALKWKKVAWGTFLTGRIEENQTPEQAAIAEINQETGYSNLKLLGKIGMVHSKFFHVPKNQNTFVHAHAFYFELEDGTQKNTLDEEKEKHEVVWLKPDEVEKFLTPEAHRFVWSQAQKSKDIYTSPGILTNSGEFDGMSSEEAKKKITEAVGGKIITTFKLRDWVFSRQRYWGEPIPMINCAACGWQPVPEEQLPVELPKVDRYEPTDTGESPLANITEWINTTCPKCGGAAKRETDVMPNWAGSSWYYLRYADSQNDTTFAAPDKLKYWTPVDWYNGGMEHTTLHLLYSRFWHKFLFDIGVVPTNEPYMKRTSHGLVLAQDGSKMSKSANNVVNPDETVREYGADSLRLYEMFMGPFDQPVAWSSASVVGVRRFLERVWRLEPSEKTRSSDDRVLETLLHQTIKKMGEDIEQLKMNTAVSALMILLNELEKTPSLEAYKIFLQLLSPFAPHIAAELWEKLGETTSDNRSSWPEYNSSKLVSSTVTVAVQVNGKTRATIELAANATEAEALAAARGVVAKWLTKPEKRVIYVPSKIINFAVDS